MFALTTKEIDVTSSAQNHLKAALAPQGIKALRLSILSGKGCGGHEYDLQPVTSAPEGHDSLKVDDDLTIFIPSKDVLKLFGSRIDYTTDDLGNTRIIIENPNEKGRCGCGLSVTF